MATEYELYKEGGLLNSRYQKLEDISKGAYGIVSLAKDITASRLVAVKYIFKLDDEGAPKKKDYENFSKSVKKMDSDVCEEALHEIAIHEKLGSHKYIIELVDCFNSFIILEYCSRGDLYEAIQAEDGPSSTRDIVNVMLQLISAVEYAHSKGIYHRDIKPENILIADDRSIRLSDWGLASESRYCNDFGVGSERYMAPELFDEINLQIYDAAKCDVWSIGICLLNLVFHKSPFTKANEKDKSFSYFACNREALFDIFSTMSVDLFTVLRHSLAIDPDNRDLSKMKEELLNVQSLTIDDDLDFMEDEVKAKPMDISQRHVDSNEKIFATQTPNTHIADHFNHFKKGLFNRKDYFTPPSEGSQFLQNYQNVRKSGVYQPPHQRPSTPKSANHLIPMKTSNRARRSFNSFSNHSVTSGKYIPPNLRSPAQAGTLANQKYSNHISAVVFEDEDEDEHEEEETASTPDDDMFVMDQSDVLNPKDMNKLNHLVSHINLDDDYSDSSSSVPSLMAPIQINESRVSSKLSPENSKADTNKNDEFPRRDSVNSNSSSNNGKKYVPPHHRQNFQSHWKTPTNLNHNHKGKNDQTRHRHWNHRGAGYGRRHSVPVLRDEPISSSAPSKSSWFNYHNKNIGNDFEEDDYEVVGSDELLDDDEYVNSELYRRFASRVGKFSNHVNSDIKNQRSIQA